MVLAHLLQCYKSLDPFAWKTSVGRVCCSLMDPDAVKMCLPTDDENENEEMGAQLTRFKFLQMKPSLNFWFTLQLLLQFQHEVTGIKVEDGDVNVTMGEDAVLQCRLTGTSETVTQITWQRKTNAHEDNFLTYAIENGVTPLNEFGRRVKFIGDGVMKADIMLPKTILSDEGGYICIFTVFPSGSYSTDIQLTVRVTPVIKVFTEDPPEAGSGESTVATCIAANGKPAATITWKTFLTEQRIENNSSLHENGTTTTRSQLQAIPVKSMHEQEVFCIVEHPTLKHPEVISHKLNIYYPPSVVVRAVEKPPDSLLLQCDADANPPATYSWIKESQSLATSNRMKIERNRLHLLAMTPAINGLYFCESRNQYGTASGTIFLHISSSRKQYGVLTGGIILILVAVAFILFFLWRQRREQTGSVAFRRNSQSRQKDTVGAASPAMIQEGDQVREDPEDLGQNKTPKKAAARGSLKTGGKLSPLRGRRSTDH
ncbi:nectin-1-like isoform X2 [Polyodon spathula]|uniref:nectin-1-like isoform X2 n=1 Tax=Polyodon spathula TaxID=7913 RepID=UPI001B7F5A62|nr:nectin-1-like isoform X2 [Polyodon spathula]